MLTIENNGGAISIFCDGQRLLGYQAITPASKPHFDFVGLPPGAADRAGTNIALAAPHDHVWHLGLYFAPKYIDGVNFWESELYSIQEEPYGAARHSGELTTRVADDGSVSFSQDIDWAESEGELYVKENRRVVIRPPTETFYRIEWQSTWRAVGAERVLTSRCATGDYAGLSFRPQRSMGGLGARVINSEGADTADQVHGQTARWADYSGKLDGRYTMKQAEWAGLTMMDHPSNRRYPTRWFCITQPFGFLAANPTFGSSWTLKPDQAETTRYGILVHAGLPDRDVIESEYNAFSNGL